MASRPDWLKVDIESLLLYIVADSPSYGYRIIKQLEARSKGYFKFKEGTLYPVLHRLERAGLIQGRWQTLPNGRQRKYYHITAKGRAALVEKTGQWRDFVTAMSLVTRPLPG